MTPTTQQSTYENKEAATSMPRVETSGKFKIKIEGLALRTTAEEIKKKLNLPFQGIEVYLYCKRKTKIALLFVPSLEEAERLLTTTSMIHGRFLLCEPYFGTDEWQEAEMETKKKVCLKKLPPKLNNLQLHKELSKYGDLYYAYCVHKAGKSMGYGFVKFKSIYSAQQLIQSRFIEVLGEPVLCEPYGDKATKPFVRYNNNQHQLESKRERQSRELNFFTKSRLVTFEISCTSNHRINNIRLNLSQVTKKI